MNIPAIRAALERLKQEITWPQMNPIMEAVITVGIRACDRLDRCPFGFLCLDCLPTKYALKAVADILREAGVEVENG